MIRTDDVRRSIEQILQQRLTGHQRPWAKEAHGERRRWRSLVVGGWRAPRGERVRRPRVDAPPTVAPVAPSRRALTDGIPRYGPCAQGLALPRPASAPRLAHFRTIRATTGALGQVARGEVHPDDR